MHPTGGSRQNRAVNARFGPPETRERGQSARLERTERQLSVALRRPVRQSPVVEIGTVPNTPDRFDFTFNNSFSWEGTAGQFDRSYQRATHGNEIFLIGRGDTEIRAQRP